MTEKSPYYQFLLIRELVTTKKTKNQRLILFTRERIVVLYLTQQDLLLPSLQYMKVVFFVLVNATGTRAKSGSVTTYED